MADDSRPRIEVSHPAHPRTVHLHCHQPGLHGGLHLLHHARQSPVERAPALARIVAGRDVDSQEAQDQPHPHVRRPVHREPGLGGEHVQADDRAEPHRHLDVQQPRDLHGRGDAAAHGQVRLQVDFVGHRERQPAGTPAHAQGRVSRLGREGAALGQGRRHHELELLRHRLADGNRSHNQADGGLRPETTDGHCALPRGRAVSERAGRSESAHRNFTRRRPATAHTLSNRVKLDLVPGGWALSLSAQRGRGCCQGSRGLTQC